MDEIIPGRVRGLGIILSKDVDSDVDMCPHEWEFVRRTHEFSIFTCKLKGCLRFVTPYRTSLDKFLQVFYTFPRIPEIPTEGYYSHENIGRMIGEDPRTVEKYCEVIDGLDLDGCLKHIRADSRIFMYRDPPELSPWLKMGTLLLTTYGGYKFVQKIAPGWEWAGALGGLYIANRATGS